MSDGHHINPQARIDATRTSNVVHRQYDLPEEPLITAVIVLDPVAWVNLPL